MRAVRASGVAGSSDSHVQQVDRGRRGDQGGRVAGAAWRWGSAG